MVAESQGSADNDAKEPASVERAPEAVLPPDLTNVGCTRRGSYSAKSVFLPSKHLLSAFYKTLTSKNPSKSLVFTEDPYWRLLRTLLRRFAVREPSKNPSKKHVVA